MFVAYLKDTGELSTPIITCSREIYLQELYEGERLEKFLNKCKFLNIEDNYDIIARPRNYYVDLETKEIKLKDTTKL